MKLNKSTQIKYSDWLRALNVVLDVHYIKVLILLLSVTSYCDARRFESAV